MHALVYGAVTDRGSVRAVNEDSILAAPPVFLVADGIGGNEAGEVASAIVVEEFTALAGRPVTDPDEVAATIAAAHDRIRALHHGHPYGACTTAVGAVAIADAAGPYWVVFNVGDSRIYQRAFGEPGLRQLSVDHSHVQELIDAGLITADQALGHPERNVVTRAVGSDDGCVPDFWVLPVVTGDRLVICSDGVFGGTPAAELDAITAVDRPAQAVAAELLAAALRHGGRDNVSAVVVDVMAEAPVGRYRSHDDVRGAGRDDHLEHRAELVDASPQSVAGPAAPAVEDGPAGDRIGVGFPDPARDDRHEPTVRVLRDHRSSADRRSSREGGA